MASSFAVTGVLLALHAMGFQTAAKAAKGYYCVFRSEDRGRTWSRSDTGLPRHARINAFGVVRGTVLAGTDHGIYKSDDRGGNWTAVRGNPDLVGRVLNFAILGTSVYAGTDSNGVLVSIDEGVTWTVTSGRRLGHVRSLLADAGALYAGTDAEGVFVSRDGGHSWMSLNEGLPAGSQIFSLVASRQNVFAALYSKGLYVWTGQGVSWRKVGAVSPLVLGTAGETLLAGHNPGGIFRSDDSGTTWGAGEIAFSEDLRNAPVWDLGAGPDFAMAGVSSGMYRSDDRGRTWARAQAGLPKRGSGISFLLGRGFVLAGVFVAE